MDKLAIPIRVKKECYKLQMNKIPSGSFIMGSNKGRGIDDWANTSMGTFEVTISRDFWMGIYPITQCQWHSVMGTSPSYFKGDNLPIESITWLDAIDFCTSLNNTILSRLDLPENYVFRLPTEAEWEYACRAGSSMQYQIGETITDLSNVAWHSDNIPEDNFITQSVGQKLPNAWGLYDMLGNVAEMCFDVPVKYPVGTSQIDWLGRGGTLPEFRNLRGCSVFHDAGVENHFTTFGRAYTSGEPNRAYGFRTCLASQIDENIL